MAHITGTITGLKAAFEKLREVLKTNATLVAAIPAQNWTELFYVEDNIDYVKTQNPITSRYYDLLEANYSSLRLFQIDGRYVTAPYPVPISGFADSAFGAVVSGEIKWKMRAAKPITSLYIKGSGNNNPRYDSGAFVLQYSDDDAIWTTVYTGTTPNTLNGETTYTGWVATGSHLFWRLTGAYTALSSIIGYNGTTIVTSSSSQSILRGPGIAGSDNIYIGFRTLRDDLRDLNLLQVFGLTGYNPATLLMCNQPGATGISVSALDSGCPSLTLSDKQMPYWITVSGRRIIFAFKVGTQYEAGYAGFFLPYTDPVNYPYPMLIGGSMDMDKDLGLLKPSARHSGHSVFCIPGATKEMKDSRLGGLKVLGYNGLWASLANLYKRSSTGGGPGETFLANGVPVNSDDTPYSYVYPRKPVFYSDVLGEGYDYPNFSMAKTGSDQYLLHPHELVINGVTLSGEKELVGVIDGTCFVSGDNNLSENIITFGGKSWVVFQNVFRTGLMDYFAMVRE